MEINDWDEMIENLDQLGIPYSHMQRRLGEADTKATWNTRDYTGNYYTYIRDPDGNTIELVHHPLGIEDSTGKKVELVHDSNSLAWTKHPEFDPTK